MVYLKHAAWIALLAILLADYVIDIEEAEYAVILNEEPFEVRAYEAHTLAEIIINGDFDSAGNIAFGTLFSYISGNNQAQQKIDMGAPAAKGAVSEEIDMTLPVGQQKAGGSWAVSFVMPASYSLDTLPEPKDSKLVLRQVTARHVAAIRYSGFWSERGYKRNMKKLAAWINDNSIRIIGEPIWARYNSPFKPWFLRRNEILVPIEY